MLSKEEWDKMRHHKFDMSLRNVDVDSINEQPRLKEQLSLFHELYSANAEYLDQIFNDAFTPMQTQCHINSLRYLLSQPVGSVLSFTETFDLREATLDKEFDGGVQVVCFSPNERLSALKGSKVILIHTNVAEDAGIAKCQLAFAVRVDKNCSVTPVSASSTNGNRMLTVNVTFQAPDGTLQTVTYVAIHIGAEKDTSAIITTRNDLLSCMQASHHEDVIVMGDSNGSLADDNAQSKTDALSFPDGSKLFMRYVGEETGYGAINEPTTISRKGIDVMGSYKKDLFVGNLEHLRYSAYEQSTLVPDVLDIMGISKYGLSDHMRIVGKTCYQTSCIVSSTLSPLLAFKTFLYRIKASNIEQVNRIMRDPTNKSSVDFKA